MRIGDLNARIVGGSDGKGGGRGPIVILMHGFGAPGEDLVPLAGATPAPEGTRFVFPEAPLALDIGFGARAWWMIDIDRLEHAIRTGETRDLSRQTPEGLARARELMVGFLEALKNELELGPIVIGGFSQGAMLACDVMLRTDLDFAGLVMMSGTLLCKEEWSRLMLSRKDIPVFMSHGTMDPLLPFELSERLYGLFEEAGFSAQFLPFEGEHEIPHPVLLGVGTFLQSVLKI